MVYYLGITINEVLTHAITWLDLENIPFIKLPPAPFADNFWKKKTDWVVACDVFLFVCFFLRGSSGSLAHSAPQWEPCSSGFSAGSSECKRAEPPRQLRGLWACARAPCKAVQGAAGPREVLA